MLNSMISSIVTILKNDNLYGVSERVEIAKGKYKIERSLKNGLEKIKRLWLIRKLR